MTEQYQSLLDECKDIQYFLEEVVSDDPHELAERLSKLCVYMARSGAILADAKYMQDQARRGVYDVYFDQITRMSATVASKFIESETGEMNYLVNWADRINKSCTHQADSLRTMLSYAKENLKLTRSGY